MNGLHSQATRPAMNFWQPTREFPCSECGVSVKTISKQQATCLKEECRKKRRQRVDARKSRAVSL